MTALVNLAQKRVAQDARTRLNIITSKSQEVSTPRSRLLGAYTIRGCGATKAIFQQRCVGWDP
eukprot:7693479-Prorocentrum_lima.AAC.1